MVSVVVLEEEAAEDLEAAVAVDSEAESEVALEAVSSFYLLMIL